MKPAIYFTLIPGWSPKCGYRVMAVTSEKPGRMIYGRDGDGCSTHRSWGDKHGEFPTQEAAVAIIASIVDIHDRFAPQLREAHARVKQIDREERDAVLAVLRDAGALRR
ncbi:hypothetical protein GG804_26375 [Sphingomonas histidinilytica]|uniref:hypothetical protein n=1 Tax=Rhizorhabdus histidinilytica TaxID=439228 RepID=UPI001ADB44F8|nr:hypothetical protein [Rhizorhabdus histidinilytica]MBO9380296.1 hypothetical protein [Rhizorhabdus histidinilytica]